MLTDETQGVCFYCGNALGGVSNARQRKRTRDHLQPIARGGSSTTANLVWCCVDCNGEKGNLTLEEYRLIVAHREGVIGNCDYKFSGEKHRPLVMGRRAF
jgi:5-methylcytosine-specific restriction endonuclease McrA